MMPSACPAQRAAEHGEGERFRRRELEAGLDQVAARALLEIVPAFEDLARPRREHGLAPPIKLDAPCAFLPNDGRAEVWPRELGLGRCSALERVVDGDVEGLEREVGAVEVGHF